MTPTILFVTLDNSLAQPVTGTISVTGLGAELRRTGTTPWTLWLGYLSHGGTLSFAELEDALGGGLLVSVHDHYLMEQARIW